MEGGNSKHLMTVCVPQSLYSRLITEKHLWGVHDVPTNENMGHSQWPETTLNQSTR